MALDNAKLQVNVLHIEADQLGYPHSGGIHHFQHGLVPIAFGVYAGGLSQQKLYLFSGKNLRELLFSPLDMNVRRNGRNLQEATGYGIGIEVFQACQAAGDSSAGFALCLQICQIVPDIHLCGIDNVGTTTHEHPFGKLPNITHIRRDGIIRCLLNLYEIVLVRLNNVQHVPKYPILINFGIFRRPGPQKHHLSEMPKPA